MKTQIHFAKASDGKLTDTHQVRTRESVKKDGTKIVTYMFYANGKHGFIHHDVKDDKHYSEASTVKTKNGKRIRVRSFSQYNPTRIENDNMRKFVSNNEPHVVFSEIQKTIKINEDKAFDMYCELLPVGSHITFTDRDDDILESLKLGYIIPQKNHDIGEGNWVIVNHPKLKPAVMYAKRSNRFNVDHIVDEFNLHTGPDDSDKDKDYLTKNKEYAQAKQRYKMIANKIRREAEEFVSELYFDWGVKPYEIFVQTHTRGGKPKKVYLHPGEYWVIQDINRYLEYVYSGGKELIVHTLSNHDMDDKIFYLRSRGISKDKAMILCNLKNTYFEFPTDAVELYNERLKLNSKVNY